jgi:hypothetical protein
VAHSTPTNQKPSNAPISIHSSAGRPAAAWRRWWRLPLPLPSCRRVPPRWLQRHRRQQQWWGYRQQSTINQKQQRQKATMTAKWTNENEGNGGDGGRLAAVWRRWRWQRGVSGSNSMAGATAVWWRQRRQRQQLGSSRGSSAVATARQQRRR